MHISIPLVIIATLWLQGCGGPSGLELQQQLTESLGSGGGRISNVTQKSGCKQTVHASANGWQFELSWFEGSLVRSVSWQSRQGGFPFEIPLKKRGSPWTYTDAGVTQTMYGPYQPSLRLGSSGELWAITMSQEQVDFPTEQDLVNMLRWPYYAESDAWALSADGTIAQLRVDLSAAGNSLDIKLDRLTVRGDPPKPGTLAPFIRGRITARCEHNASINR
jgi:hypothetical protein